MYALPGRICDPLSYGCNSLIKQGAQIITDMEEFVKDLTIIKGTNCTQIDFRKNLLEKDESLVYSLLDFCPTGIGTLMEKLPFQLMELLVILQQLEQKGFIRETAANYYVKTL